MLFQHSAQFQCEGYGYEGDRTGKKGTLHIKYNSKKKLSVILIITISYCSAACNLSGGLRKGGLSLVSGLEVG